MYVHLAIFTACIHFYFLIFFVIQRWQAPHVIIINVDLLTTLFFTFVENFLSIS